MKVRTSLNLAFLAVLFSLGLITINEAWAEVSVRIQLSQQTMDVEVDGIHLATWTVSTARRGYRTPTGSYKPYQLDRIHYSSLYENAPMPYSIFFHGGYAIHGTTEVRNLGRAVSHGCVRLHPDNARTLFELVRQQGMQSTTITILQ
jgi:lipoprotein-anchoring transpeptidase ErfK/SrfK